MTTLQQYQIEQIEKLKTELPKPIRVSKQNRDLFFDYCNNYLTVDKFALDNQIPYNDAIDLIKSCQAIKYIDINKSFNENNDSLLTFDIIYNAVYKFLFYRANDDLLNTLQANYTLSNNNNIRKYDLAKLTAWIIHTNHNILNEIDY